MWGLSHFFVILEKGVFTLIFKAFKGEEKNLPSNTVAGHLYFTVDTNNLYIDIETKKYKHHINAIQEGSRVQIRADKAKLINFVMNEGRG
jgi:hypothetical protein